MGEHKLKKDRPVVAVKSRPTMRERFKDALGTPNELKRVNGADMQVRDDLGISLDPKALASADCRDCRGNGLVVKYRPLTPKQVIELLMTDPQSKGALIYRCPHDIVLKDACKRCERPENRYVNRDCGRGAVFQSVATCGCVADNHRQLRKELLAGGAHYSGYIPGAMQLQKQVQQITTSAQCQHGVKMQEPCSQCGRTEPAKIEFKVKS